MPQVTHTTDISMKNKNEAHHVLCTEYDFDQDYHAHHVCYFSF